MQKLLGDFSKLTNFKLDNFVLQKKRRKAFRGPPNKSFEDYVTDICEGWDGTNNITDEKKQLPSRQDVQTKLIFTRNFLYEISEHMFVWEELHILNVNKQAINFTRVRIFMAVLVPNKPNGL